MELFKGQQVKGEIIPKRRLVTAWKSIIKRPLPKVKAFILTDEDFNSVLEQRQCHEDDMREIEEWGQILSIKGTDACVFNSEESESVDFIILVRKNRFHKLDEILMHELTHIARGDL